MNSRSGHVQRFPLGMTYEGKRFPKAKELTTYKVVDVLRTFNSINDCVGIEYVVEHFFAGQPVIERVVDTTIARKLTNEQLSQYLITNEEQQMPQYRRKPQHEPPLDIPWHLIAPEWKCAAMDEDKIIWFYTVRPCKSTDNWATAQGYAAANVLTINTDGIDWENSLTFRPE